MIQKIISATLFSFLCFNVASAQTGVVDQQAYGYYQDVDRFATLTNNGSTARYAGIGGAATSLGGDMGSLYVNPAGLGMCRKSEFSFSPVIGYGGTNSSYSDQLLNKSASNTNNQNDGRVIFGLSNIGLIFSGAKDDLEKGDWRGGSFGISFSRTNTFQSQKSFYGINQNNSMADGFAQQADGTQSSAFDNNDPSTTSNPSVPVIANLAYWTYLINPTSANGSIYSSALSGEDVKQEGTVTTKGAQFAWNISYGGNYKDKLYFGASLGIATIRNIETLNYTETSGVYAGRKFYPNADTSALISSFTYNDNNTVTGTGVDLKVGIIYKLSDVVRLGTTVKTPTYYWMNNDYNTTITAYYAPNPLGVSSYSYSTPPGTFSYNFVSPWRISQGISIFAGKHGFISADVEYVPYRSSSLSWDNSYGKSIYDNNTIDNVYRNVFNVRAGGELRLGLFRLRGGFGYLPTPLYNSSINRDVIQITGGAGIRLESFYIDFSVINNSFNSSYNAYSLYDNNGSDVAPTANIKNSQTTLVISTGVYF